MRVVIDSNDDGDDARDIVPLGVEIDAVFGDELPDGGEEEWDSAVIDGRGENTPEPEPDEPIEGASWEDLEEEDDETEGIAQGDDEDPDGLGIVPGDDGEESGEEVPVTPDETGDIIAPDPEGDIPVPGQGDRPSEDGSEPPAPGPESGDLADDPLPSGSASDPVEEDGLGEDGPVDDGDTVPDPDLGEGDAAEADDDGVDAEAPEGAPEPDAGGEEESPEGDSSGIPGGDGEPVDEAADDAPEPVPDDGPGGQHEGSGEGACPEGKDGADGEGEDGESNEGEPTEPTPPEDEDETPPTPNVEEFTFAPDDRCPVCGKTWMEHHKEGSDHEFGEGEEGGPKEKTPKTPKTPKGDGGRSEKRQRTVYVAARLTEEEREEIVKRAKADGVTIGEYIRTKCLGHESYREKKVPVTSPASTESPAVPPPSQ